MVLPATIGEDHPRPGIGAVHSILEVVDHFSGRLELLAQGLERGPRKPGHSASPAKTQAARNSDAKTFLIVLLTIAAVRRPWWRPVSGSSRVGMNSQFQAHLWIGKCY